mmetsp:Transcript_19020/g.23401  ORF Transcript_19020/g.23401 Transcript_19020/m.23401 type:complete len:560 (-) Transcript_19020:403-2082(-)
MSSKNDGTSADEAVSQFLAITGSSDASQAQTYLEMSANNLETAIGLYLEHQNSGGGGGGGGGFNNSSSSRSGSGRGVSFNDGVGGGDFAMGGDDDIRAPDRTRSMRLMDFDDGPDALLRGVGGGNDMAGLLHHPILGPHAASMMNDAAAAGHAHGYHAAAGNPNMIPRMRAFDDDDDLDDYENSGMGLRRDVNLNSFSGGNFRDVINAATANDDLHSSLRSSSAATAGGSSNNGFFGNDSSGDIHMENTSSNGRSQRLSDLFSPPVHLIHSAGGFQGARNVAKDSRRPRMRAFDDDDDLDDYENSGMGLRRDVNLNSFSGGNFRDVINAATANDDLHSSLRSSSAATAGGSSNNGFFGNDSSGDIHMENTSSNGRSQRLSDLFSPPVHLIHSAGGFQGARNVAKDSRRWLLVNVQSDSEFACHALNRDVWRNDLVESLVREGFVFWQSVNTSPEGQTYCQRYKVNALPHIGIIDPRTGMKVLSKEGWTMENPMTADQFAEMAIDFCSRNSFDKPPAAPSSTRGSGTSKNNSSSMSSSNANAASSSSISKKTLLLQRLKK